MRYRGTAAAAAGLALLAALAVAGVRGVRTGRDPMGGNQVTAEAVRPDVPEIDRRIPARTESATFALG